ncbi:hypothetical protein PBI_STROKESEAT_87 [Mycobacterium phage Strokeseat]|uniref:Uncharacterized protein n=1 Tax=Mycobacterium phage Hlubikazi TaxID=2767559 RepID=A0A7G9V049_9CAUD|nr:hypothetical protein I5H48_gp087 [Mycobacterium phage Hlubikazi]QGJ91185.1 hypothetical protein PBI_STROKESEAT_87 [Mycobacterium phage Strokeseat]QNN99104.1 hypothetical protein PBI_MANDLOVU_87 [Mycobacterium phage Mandlovu]QNN99654.1 hypothetical protein PBI_HLUBIKAZI_87 [Mycobacterium phage Hlubikazi]
MTTPLSVILASQARFLVESPVCPVCFQPRAEHSTDCKGHHKWLTCCS